MSTSTRSLPITRFTSGFGQAQNDWLTVEEPLEISIRYGKALQQKNLSVTMRTPGQDEDLALGFLVSEGIIHHYDQVVGVMQEAPNGISVILDEGVAFDPARFERHVYTTSSCGICAKASIEAVRTESAFLNTAPTWTVSPAWLHQLPERVRQHQQDFVHTGGLHAAALFHRLGTFQGLYEDVGRHNALDKLVGAALKNDQLPLRNTLLLLSGRASFELIQKASLAGISFVAAIGAPSTLAVDLAHELHITLVGFLRQGTFNVYTGPERIREY